MNKLLKLILYMWLHRQTATLNLNAYKLARGSYAQIAAEGSDCLSELELYDDALPLFSANVENSAADNSAISQSFVQDRWLGRGNILNVQMLTAIPSTILNNVNLKSVFRCPDPVQAEAAVKLLGLPRENVPIVQGLPDRHYFLWFDGLETPIVVKTPDMDLGRTPGQDSIDRHMKPILDEIDARLVLSPPFEDHIEPICYMDDDDPESVDENVAAEIPLPDTPASIAAYVTFLAAVARNKYPSTRALNAALAMSAGKAVKIRAALVKHGYIEIHKESGATGRPRLIVKITPRGLDLLSNGRLSQ